MSLPMPRNIRRIIPPYNDMVRMLGAEPVALEYGQVYGAIQRGHLIKEIKSEVVYAKV